MTSYEFEKVAKNAVINVLSDDVNFIFYLQIKSGFYLERI